MRPTVSATIVSLALAVTFGAGAGLAQDREGPREIRWPSPEYRTLQAAIDALADGGVLRIAAGRFELAEGLMIRSKRITIEGAGCDARRRNERDRTWAQAAERRAAGSGRIEIPTRDERAPRVLTSLFGPPTRRVVPARQATGVLNYIDAGGLVRGVHLAGFDAGVVGRDGSDAARASRPLTLEETCISDTGRGVYWQSGSGLGVFDSRLENTLWHGLVVSALHFQSPLVTVHNTFIAEALGACIIVWNSTVTLQNLLLVGCNNPDKVGGIAALNNSHLSVFTSWIFVTKGPGITAVDSHLFAVQNRLLANVKAGVLLFQSTAAVNFNRIILPLPDEGSFGDGVVAMLSPNVWLTDNNIRNAPRCGISNFGSFVSLGENHIWCAGFSLEVDPFFGTPGLFENRGGNQCGCPDPTIPSPQVGPGGDCVSESIGLAPPAPVVLDE